jgi:hypothetical protein
MPSHPATHFASDVQTFTIAGFTCAIRKDDLNKIQLAYIKLASVGHWMMLLYNHIKSCQIWTVREYKRATVKHCNITEETGHNKIYCGCHVS